MNRFGCCTVQYNTAHQSTVPYSTSGSVLVHKKRTPHPTKRIKINSLRHISRHPPPRCMFYSRLTPRCLRACTTHLHLPKNHRMARSVWREGSGEPLLLPSLGQRTLSGLRNEHRQEIDDDDDDGGVSSLPDEVRRCLLHVGWAAAAVDVGAEGPL